MRLLVLPQTFHDGEVHSVDVNSTNSMIATGGKDQKVSVWKLDDFTKFVDNDPPSLEELIPQNVVQTHGSTVKIIKWSPTSEHELISADANGELVKTNIDSDKSQTIFPPPHSNKYKKSAVIDGSWSVDGRLFAWSTQDGAVHIYDATKDTHQFLVPRGENATGRKATIQRSVAFDPTGKYLVILGDDTMVAVYQYDFDKSGNYRFLVASKISRLMSNSVTKASGVNYRRISWSCDGEFFAVPNATKQSTSVVSLLSASSGWENNISLVGHDMECDLVKFAPQIFERRGESESAPGESDLEILDYEVYHIIATAGSNNSLVLWNTSKEAPLFVMNDISSKPCVDLVWEKTGKYILMTTLDGQIIIVGFSEGELGDKVSSEFLEKFKATQNQAKKQPSGKGTSELSGAKKAKAPIECISQNDAVNILDEGDIDKANDSHISAHQENGSSPKQTIALQRGEISPEVLTPGIDIRPDIENDFMSAIEATSGERKQETKVSKSSESRNANYTAENSTLSGASKVTMKNGKKRVQPIALSNGNGIHSKTSEATAQQQIASSQSTQMSMEFEKPSYNVSEELTRDTKRQKISDDSIIRKKPRREPEPVRYIGSVVTNPTTSFAQVRLSAPKVRSAFRIPDDSYSLDIKNGQGNESAPSRVTCLKEDTQLWSDFIPQFIQLVTKGASFWALSTADGTIHTYSSESGRRLLPPIVIGSPISFLESKSHFLMAVTSIAEVYVWDLNKRKIHMKSPSSLAALLDLNSKLQENTLSKADNITMCSITSKGIPVTTLSNGSGYIYNIEMEVWQTVTEAWWAFGSHYWDSITDDKASTPLKTSQGSSKSDGSSIIGMLEHKTNEELLRKSRVGRGKLFNKISKNMMMKEGFENLENTVSLSHLENRILCCELLGEQTDFKNYLITYANRICELGLQAKLFEICEGIISPSNSETDKATICGINRRELLKDILLACAEHRDVQRMLVHFGNKIGLLSRDYE
ncbi:hypothetical protein OXX80_005966 [Metschnikowia pulcherrima]